jgi:hypothetical protein
MFGKKAEVLLDLNPRMIALVSVHQNTSTANSLSGMLDQLQGEVLTGWTSFGLPLTAGRDAPLFGKADLLAGVR